MPLETVVYDLSAGLDIHLHSIKDVADNSVVRMPGDELMQPLASSELFNNVRGYLNTYDRFSGKLDQRVHYALLNDETENPDITLINLQWAGKFQSQENQAAIAELVAANPDRRFLVYDNLGYGKSDPMPKAAAKELPKTGRFDTYAEIVYGALSTVIQDYDELDILGRSEGGIIGTELVAHAEKARSLIVFDPPSTDLKLWSLFNRFSVLEKAHGQSYLKALEQSGNKMPETDLSNAQLLALVARDIVTGRIVIQTREAQAMSVGAYGKALTNALRHIDERYVYLSPNQSEMNTPEFIRTVISEAARSSAKLPKAIAQIAFNGTHAFAYGNPRALTVLETHSLVI